jgi:hypothetical protein
MSLRSEFDAEMLKLFDSDEEELKELIRVGRKFSFGNCDILEVTHGLEQHLAETRIERDNFVKSREDDSKHPLSDEGTEDADGDWLPRQGSPWTPSGGIDGDSGENVARQDDNGKPDSVDAGVAETNGSSNVFIGDGRSIPFGEDFLF